MRVRMPESRHLRDCPEGMTMKKEIMLCMHAGSGNHGCEAIAESLLLQMKSQPALPLPAVLVTNSAAEDLRYGLGSMQNVCRIVEEKHIAGHPAAHAFLYAWRKLSGDRESFPAVPVFRGHRETCARTVRFRRRR